MKQVGLRFIPWWEFWISLSETGSHWKACVCLCLCYYYIYIIYIYMVLLKCAWFKYLDCIIYPFAIIFNTCVLLFKFQSFFIHITAFLFSKGSSVVECEGKLWKRDIWVKANMWICSLRPYQVRPGYLSHHNTH